MNTKLILRYIYVLASNAAYAVIGYMAYQGHPNWNNVFVFLTWMSLIGGLAMFNEDIARKHGGNMKLADEFYGVTTIVFIAAAVWAGWWWTAIALFVAAVGSQSGRDEYRKFVKKAQQCQTTSSETGPLSNTESPSPSA